MGVYIKGMEMPKDGRYTLCITHDSDGSVHWVIQNQDTLKFLKHGAVTEITEPHGRLIDADAIEQDAQKRLLMCNKNNNQFQKPYEVMRAIADTPTIIPASEEELVMNNIADDLVIAFNDGYEKGKSDAEAYIFHCDDPKPKTNADRIRNMTDEGLDKFLGKVQWDVANYCGGVTQKQEYPVPEQSGAWLNWLKQEVEYGDNEL